MSSSTVRKNRQDAITRGTDKKTIAYQKESAKKKKEKIKWTIVVALIVLFFAFVLYLNSGAFYRNLHGMTVQYEASSELGIEAGRRSFSVAECNYMYNASFMNLYNSLGDYASMIGLDTQKPFDEQVCTMVEDKGDDYTWDDYFNDATYDALKELAILEAFAVKNGVTLDDDDMQVINDNVATFDAAKDYGYASPDKFIAANYGKGVNAKVMHGMLELQQLAAKAQQGVSDAFTFTAEELAAKYETVKNDWDGFTYSYYLVAAEITTDEEGNEAAPTEEALAKASETANAIKDKMDKESLSLADAAKAVVAGAEVADKSAVAGSETEPELTEWLVSADRAKGDYAVVDASGGSYVVVFTERDNNRHKTDDSGDMNYCDYIAKNLLSNEKLSAWHTEKVGPAEEAAVVDPACGYRYVGR